MCLAFGATRLADRPSGPLAQHIPLLSGVKALVEMRKVKCVMSTELLPRGGSRCRLVDVVALLV